VLPSFSDKYLSAQHGHILDTFSLVYAYDCMNDKEVFPRPPLRSPHPIR